MPGRTPTEAYFQFIEPVQTALNYIAVGRFSIGPDVRALQIDTSENASLNNGDPTPVRSSLLGPLFVAVGVRLRIVRIDVGSRPFDCLLTGYWFSVFTRDEQEILAFHWTPDVAKAQRPFPHLHIGSVVSSGGEVLPERFHKLHIPTEVVSIESFVRFAIEELGVDVRQGLERQSVLRLLSAGPSASNS